MSEDEVANPCWCCGRECMFCDPEDPQDEKEHLVERHHWCAECKFVGCENCR